MLPEFSNDDVSFNKRRIGSQTRRAVAGNGLALDELRVGRLARKIAEKFKLIEEASEPENLISVELVMLIHTHPLSKSLKAIEEGKVHRLSPETKSECAR